MAKALPAGRAIKRRPLFGLFDPDGWGWATTKAFFWLLVLIMTLGYIPDRAYYFVVSRTLELGILGWSPVNLCPPENGRDMPCPVPVGGVVPWQPTPAEAALPKPRTGGTAAQLGKHLLYIGGSDGSAPSATTFITTVDKGNFGAWADGPALPEARTNASLAILSGTAYLVGGLGPDGKPTNTVWSIGLNPDTGALGAWTAEVAKVKLPTLPEARAGAAIVAVSDGIIVAGGIGPDKSPTATVWKATVDSAGKLGAFKEQPALPRAVTDASAALEGTFLWVYGGSDAHGPTAAIQRADYGSASTASGSAAPGVPSSAASALPPAVTPAARGTAAPAPTVSETTAPASPAASESAASPAASESAAPGESAAPAATAAPSQALAGTAAPAASAPAASGAAPQSVLKWAVSDAANLPAPRTGGAGFAANGAIYLAGGSDGTSPKRELYWALPDSSGNLPGGWRHLDKTDLPTGLVHAAPVVTAGTVVLIGGTSDKGAVATSLRASLAPQTPFFRLGLVGLTVPALQIGGEIGQQLGYLAAAGVGTGNFVILVIVGWALNHRPQLKEWRERRRLAREARAPAAES